MATKTIQASGGDYATPQLWVSYVAALGTLSAPEIGEMAAEEFNSGSLLMTGGTVVASGTNQIILRPQAGAKFTAPLRYGSGARILFDGTDEYLYANWNHIVLEDFAVKGGATSSLFGRVWFSYNLTSTAKNLLVEENFGPICFDDRGAAASVRENLLVIRTGGTGTSGIRSANFNKSYLNCSSIAVGGGTTSTAFTRAYATPTWINCVARGYSTDYHATYGAGSKNCATDLASGSSNIAAMTGAQFEVASGDFVSVTNGSHDLSVASGSTKLKDLGAASGGTTTDILGNSISGGTRDIGAHEYQAAGGSIIINPLGGPLQMIGYMT